VLAEARLAQPEIFGDLARLRDNLGGQLVGLENEFKSLDSIVRKLDWFDKSSEAEPIGDVLRYTMTFEADELAGGTASAVRNLKDQGYRVLSRRDDWGAGSTYYGSRLTLESPTGVRFELQFHTPESWRLKDLNHVNYEIRRAADATPLEDWAYGARMRQVYDDNRFAIPPGVDDLGAITSRGVPEPPDSLYNMGLVDNSIVDELLAKGENINPGRTVFTARLPDGRPVWLESGSQGAGLEHIFGRHVTDFVNKGVAPDELIPLLQRAITEGNIVGTSGKARPVFRVTLADGTELDIAIELGSNGFIVGAHPPSKFKPLNGPQ
jgi:hypothetical protein